MTQHRRPAPGDLISYTFGRRPTLGVVLSVVGASTWAGFTVEILESSGCSVVYDVTDEEAAAGVFLLLQPA